MPGNKEYESWNDLFQVHYDSWPQSEDKTAWLITRWCIYEKTGVKASAEDTEILEAGNFTKKYKKSSNDFDF